MERACITGMTGYKDGGGCINVQVWYAHICIYVCTSISIGNSPNDIGGDDGSGKLTDPFPTDPPNPPPRASSRRSWT